MVEFGFIMALVAIIVFATSAGMGIYIMAEKGRSQKVGAIVGLIPFIGHFFLAFVPASDRNVLQDAKERNLISKDEFIEKTQIIDLKK